MIDLHCHTINSDATDTTIELLKKAQEKGITLLSITDHDTTKAYFVNSAISYDVDKFPLVVLSNPLEL